MDEEQRQAFNLAVDLYTDLLFEQKELIFRIIETSYSKGYEVARLQMLQAQQQAEYELHQQPEPKPEIKPGPMR